MTQKVSFQNPFCPNTYKSHETSSAFALKSKNMARQAKLLGLLMLVLALPVLVSCSDDGEELPLENVIVGKWHTYKASVTTNGSTKKVSVTKDGEYASLYLEADVASNGTAVLRGWRTDGSGQAMYWGEEERYSYTIQGNELTMTDSSGERINATYYPKDKNFAFTFITTDYYTGYLITATLYFKK